MKYIPIRAHKIRTEILSAFHLLSNLLLDKIQWEMIRTLYSASILPIVWATKGALCAVHGDGGCKKKRFMMP
jgi:hypothetical protein